MKIIIPMAGAGSRFTKIGIQKFKHEIIAFDKSLFEWSMLSLSDFFEYEFIFLIRKGMPIAPLQAFCDKLGISQASFVTIDKMTAGQASTVMKAQDLLEESDSVVIYNIDTYVEEGHLIKADITPEALGYVPAFIAEGDKWSFVKTDPNDSKTVIEITEKVRISNLGTLGLYYFKHWGDFKSIYQNYREEIITNYKETYIAPMYQYMIHQGKKIETSIIPIECIHVLGTPEDLTQFCPDFLQQNGVIQS